MSKFEPKPCQHCGSLAQFVDDKDAFENTERGVTCTACPATMTYHVDALPHDDLKSEDDRMVAAWNRRAPDPVREKLVGALRKAEIFISGFEGDETQEGIAELLSGIRAAIAKATGEAG